ncbi:MAG: HpcH/HpaI aldolase family protein [Rhodospirillales bacterium]|jgi:4-hydroxy-2-oxoheptanedioate aldolase
MTESTRLNGAIRALADDKPAFACFSAPSTGAAQALATQAYDAVVFELEHNYYDPGLLRDCMQYMLNRQQIVESGTLSPVVAPFVRIPPNGAEMNQFIAKQVLELGVYGVVWPHVSTVDEARNCVASCRYPRPETAPNYEPAGLRGDAPRNAALYWGISQQEYYKKADVWPLAPQGEVLCTIMIEDLLGLKNLPKMLEEVPGIGMVLIGEGDLSQSMGHPRQYDQKDVAKAIDDILQICLQYKVVCGHPHVDANNVEELLERGFRWLMSAPVQSYPGLKKGRELAKR